MRPLDPLAVRPEAGKGADDGLGGKSRIGFPDRLVRQSRCPSTVLRAPPILSASTPDDWRTADLAS
jgi:hypothetical protein